VKEQGLGQVSEQVSEQVFRQVSGQMSGKLKEHGFEQVSEQVFREVSVQGFEHDMVDLCRNGTNAKGRRHKMSLELS